MRGLYDCPSERLPHSGKYRHFLKAPVSSSAPLIAHGIDRSWLERELRAHPIVHAFAAWDLLHAPDRVRFVSFRTGDTTTAYLLIWQGNNSYPVVHWIDAPHGPDELAEGLPERPLVAVVPPHARGAVEYHRGPVQSYHVELWVHPHGASLPAGLSRTSRRLTPADENRLRDFVRVPHDLLLSTYPAMDLAATYVVGSFEGEELVAVGRAAVELPDVWILSGIYTHPDHRGRGHAAAVTAGLTAAAHASGAVGALYVRSDNAPARRAYATVGYQFDSERFWLDAGANASP